MKKLFFILSAFALLGLSSCVEPVEHNPNYDAATNSVNTNFVFNVSTSNTPQTKMTAANTQATIDQTFLGIDNAHLLAYKLGIANDGKIVAATTSAEKTFNLGKVLSAGELDPDGSAPKSRRVLEIALPVETNALMFWGKAIKSKTDDQQGKVTFTPGAVDISTYSFGLEQRITSTSAGGVMMAHYQEMIANLLNDIVQSGYTAAAGALTWGTGIGGDGSSNASAIDLKWSDYVDVSTSGVLTAKTTDPYDGSTMNTLGEILADSFVTFNTVYSNEARAGSGAAVLKMLTDLYAVIHKVAEAKANSYQEFVAKQVAIQIRLAIRQFTSDGTVANAISTLMSNAGVSYTDMQNEVIDFPDAITEIGLPKGAAQLQVAISTTAPVATWSYTNNVNSSPAGSTHSIYNYTYPAELCYFGNSPIRVSDMPHITTEYPDGSGSGTGEWMADASWSSDWTANKHVLSTTRSVAMLRNINYGTALLKSSVAFATGVTELQDNNAAIQFARTGATEANNTFAATSGQFTLTGILIGGQSETVGWNYLPTGTFNKVVYDKDIVNAAVPTPTGGENYTLVWDNYTDAATGQDAVYVALEFVNGTNKDFWGEENLVRNGGTFYLVGKLDPKATGLAAINWPTDYSIPPYQTDGSSTETPRVFIQDYMTTANFVLNATSLQHAYVTVPDLRSTQISLGLSVDLQWQTGLNFENVVLGAN